MAVVGGVHVPDSPLSPAAAVTVNNSIPVVVTANSGANLNTSALALDASVAALKAALQPYQGVVAIVVGTPYAAGRGLAINCTLAGNVTVTMADSSVLTFKVPAGFMILNIATTDVQSTTAAATFYNMV